jgi:hypothetical protein
VSHKAEHMWSGSVLIGRQHWVVKNDRKPERLHFGKLCEGKTMNEIEIKNDNVEMGNEPQATAEQSASTPTVVARHESAPSGARVTLRTLRAETEMQAISQALQQTGWNRKRAAQLLSISYRGLLYKIRQHNITRDQNFTAVPKRPKIADTLNEWETPGLAVAGGGTQGED